ncbi:MAG: SDR family NAD(P)-dependent oxidoreductase, partial [Pseudohongiellaceae bacterium]
MNILITGTTSGIGLKLAQDYLSAGNTVYCCGRNESVLHQLVGAFGDKAIPISFDMQDRED